ncbi:ribonuclease H-like domain-containing protein [Tanacetum coccineum]
MWGVGFMRVKGLECYGESTRFDYDRMWGLKDWREKVVEDVHAEAEYHGVANVFAETCGLRNLLRELHTLLSSATLFYYNNVSVIYLSSNLVQHQLTKHIDIDIYSVCDLVVVGQVRVLHVPFRYQYADIVTKGFPSALVTRFVEFFYVGKGAILLRNSNSGSGSNGVDVVICKLCCQDDILDALTLDYIRVLISQRKSTRAEIATLNALDQVVGNNFVSEKIEAPPLSMLMPLSTGLRQSYWRALVGTSSAELIIVLGNLFDVFVVVLLVSPCGYSMSDSPTFKSGQEIEYTRKKDCVLENGKLDHSSHLPLSFAVQQNLVKMVKLLAMSDLTLEISFAIARSR